MPDRRSPTADQRSEALVRDAAAQAASLVQQGFEEAQEKAINRALRDERVDRDLRDHQRRLDSINGSQEKTARELAKVNETLAKQAEAHGQQAAVAKALSEHLEAEGGRRFSRRTLWITGAAAFAAWGSIITALLTQQ